MIHRGIVADVHSLIIFSFHQLLSLKQGLQLKTKLRSKTICTTFFAPLLTWYWCHIIHSSELHGQYRKDL